ncbi:MAG: hypothetical protein U1E99_07070 [Agitococcus sp.]
MKKLLTLSAAALASSLMVAAPTAQAGYTTTKYPTLLVHGILGFKNFWGYTLYMKNLSKPTYLGCFLIFLR